MNPCESHQAQLLLHLFGLLDDAEAASLRDHLAGCAACQAAWKHTEEQQRLLATAAKGEFPEVQFRRPADAEPKLLPMPGAAAPARRRRLSLRRWAVAASVFFALSGSLLYGGYSWYDRYSRLTEAEREADRLARSRDDEKAHIAQEMHDVRKTIADLETNWRKDVERVQREGAENSLPSVTGPANLQAGAPNAYHFTLPPQEKRGDGAPRNEARLHAYVRDEAKPDPKNNVVYEQDIDNADKPLVLPQSVPLTPKSRLVMEVRATDPTNNKVLWTRRVPLTVPDYLTHLATDRYLYLPGETVYFRSLTLQRWGLRPADKDFQLEYRITDPRGNEVFKAGGLSQVKGPTNQVLSLGGRPVRGLGVADFPIPPFAAEGEYTLTVREANELFPPQTRKFLVKRFQAPRLNKEIEFTRKSYGPGDEVVAEGKVAKVEGGAKLAGQPVVAEAQVDGVPCEVANKNGLRTDADGKVTVRFRLPARIERGEGTLMLAFTDGATRERIVRPVPIVLRKLLVDFYPEGGELVAGLPNRVYFQAQTTLTKPAELHGRVVDQDGREVAAAQTLHDDREPGVNQGMGRFEFTPQPGKRYELKIDSPLGVEGQYPLPRIQRDGVVLSVPEGAVSETIRVVLHTTKSRNLLVGAYCRGRLVHHEFVTAKPGRPNVVELKTAGGPGGVYRVTVFEERRGAARPFKPVAERLLYRRPDHLLHFTVTPDKMSYGPGDRVTLTVKARDEKGGPAAAVVLLSAVDQSFVKLGDEKTARTMPTHFYLTTEVKQPKDLEYADFLVSRNPKAEAALDLLLGTQGWRRFLEQTPDRLRELQQKVDNNRALLALAAPPEKRTDLNQQAVKNVDQEYGFKWVDALEQLNEKEDREEQVDAGQTQIEQARRAAAAAAADLEGFYRTARNLAVAVLAGLLLVGGLAALVVGLRRLQTERAGAMPLYVGGVCSLAVLLVGTLVVVLPFVANRPQHGPEGAAFAVRKDGALPPGPQLDDRMKDKAPAGDKGAPRLEAFPMAPMPPGGAGMMGGFGGPPGANAKGFPGGKFGGGPGMPMAMPQVRGGGKAKGGKGAMPAMILPQRRDLPFDAKEAQGLANRGGMRVAAKALAGAAGPGLDVPPKGNLAERPPVGRGMPGAAGGFMPPPPMPMDGLQFGGLKGVNPGNDVDRALRRQRQFHALAVQRLQRGDVLMPPASEPFALREYAHRHPTGTAKQDVRSDFAATLLWQPALVLPDGSATVAFDLSDAVTSFEVVAYGHTADGRLGAAKTTLESRLPFHVEPKLPVEVSNTDKIRIPVSVNNASASRRDVELTAEATGLDMGQEKRHVRVGPRKNVSELFDVRPTILEGTVDLLFTARSQPFGLDQVRRSFTVVPEGFPQVGKQSDVLEGVETRAIEMPETWVPGTLKCQLQVYPSTLADLQKGLEGLLRQPGGCFEQSSASNYPNVLILNYLKASDQALPEVEQKARALLNSGYRQLTSFECIDPQQRVVRRGYEWFGQTAPPHEALTAYGLLEFRDMERVFPVDKEMIERTRKYLLDQRDGRGGFKRNARAIDSFGRAPQHITNAYIVWALTESGETEVDRELDALAKQAETSKDPYFLALVGNSLINRNKADAGVAVLKKLAGHQKEEGYLDAAETSITHSGGNDLRIETTALSVLAWLKANRPGEFQDNVRKAVTWVGKQRGGYGGFGSTQSTILALKSLIAFTKENRKTAEAGTLQLRVNGQSFVKEFPAGVRDEIVLSIPDADKVLQPGKNRVQMEISGKNVFPYTLTWSYRTQKPAHDATKCPVHLTTKLDRAVAKDRVRLTAVVENKSGKGQGMTVAILGLPGGLEVPADMRELRDMARLRENGTKPGFISAFEIKGRELILYWRDLAPGQRIEVNLDLLCMVPGEYRGPASRAYLYYNADHTFWTEPLSVTIEP